MKNKSLLMTIAISLIAMSSFAQAKGSFTDARDGKIYKTVKIGTQTWMAENIAYITSSGCWAYNDSIKYVAKYGYLYNWETAKTVCPIGWHLPTDAEWTTLTNYLGGDSVAGGELKEIGTTHWESPNNGASNQSGFTALPGGNRDFEGTFSGIGYAGCWWSSTENEITTEGGSRIAVGGRWDMNFSTNEVWGYESDKVDGLYVRCVRDL